MQGSASSPRRKWAAPVPVLYCATALASKAGLAYASLAGSAGGQSWALLLVCLCLVTRSAEQGCCCSKDA